MEDRYEIRGKIGQGGLGSVYRAFDNKMNREVAIKRISPGNGDEALEEESTRQLIKEASALASLQHPHIVTVYDVGQDDDGPYVVMELLSGKALDELIEKAPLTWSDFRELALQTQEALIAAQELDLIHSDIKPSNLMLTWLPSGKFQMKIVDFGLAVLTQSQNKEDLESMEAVFGSIFFMAPEQFERVPVDARADMYSMGCVYYQALTGKYPFDGKTGNEVMTAHLHHTVTPIEELRPDIPPWAATWIMWHINRYPQDRPENAREALSIFLQNDKLPTTSLGTAPAMDSPKRPRLIIPGSEPAPPAAPTQPAAEPEPLAAPAAEPAAAEPDHPATPATGSVPVPSPVADDVSEETGPVKTQSMPQPLTPPEGSKPSVHTSQQEIPPPPEPEPIPTQPRATRAPAVPTHLEHRHKGKMSNATKTMIAAILGILVVVLAWVLLNRSGKNRETARYNEIIQEVAKPEATEVPMNKADFDILLRAVTFTGATDSERRQVIYKALFVAKAKDGSDFDQMLAEFATTKEMNPAIRKVLLQDVLRKRGNPAIVPVLLDYAQAGNSPEETVAALTGIRFLAGDDHFDVLIQIIQTATDDSVRKAAEETTGELIESSTNRLPLADKLTKAYEGSVNEKARHSILRLIGRCGGTEALELVKSVLQDGGAKDQVAAVLALANWGDNTGFPLLTEFLRKGTDDPQVRNNAFKSAVNFLTREQQVANPLEESQWRDLASIANDSREKKQVVDSLVFHKGGWAEEIIKSYANDPDPYMADLTERALRARKDRFEKDGE